MQVGHWPLSSAALNGVPQVGHFCRGTVSIFVLLTR
jgi:hypothetical protein